MVAAITDSRGEFLAVHRTWLSPQPNGSVVKAAVAEPKKTLGPIVGAPSGCGAAIRQSLGPTCRCIRRSLSAKGSKTL